MKEKEYLADTLELPKRSRYYQSQMDVALLEKGDDYSALPASFVIFICSFDLFGMGRHVYTFTRRCPDIDGRISHENN